MNPIAEPDAPAVRFNEMPSLNSGPGEHVNPKQPTLANPQLISALTHPTRVHALTVLNERTASPAEIAKELDRSIRHVTYHLEKLEKLGCVELVGVERAHGGGVVAKRYRATQRPWVDREAWKQMDSADQPGITSAILANMNEDIATALTGGSINEGDNHISRTPMVLDPESYEELVGLLAETLDRVLEIQERATNRLSAGEREAILTKVHIIQFISPDPGG
jgi:DNA-binding transcriptional ArsR family regulator